MAADYGAGSIQVLKGLEAVRKRPGMYIGSTGPKGLHHLVYETVDNSIDEAMAGFCDNIVIALEKDDIVRVEDNGRGIPIGIHEKAGIPAVEVHISDVAAREPFRQISYPGLYCEKTIKGQGLDGYIQAIRYLIEKYS